VLRIFLLMNAEGSESMRDIALCECGACEYCKDIEQIYGQLETENECNIAIEEGATHGNECSSSNKRN
jgi:hypothetical protein